MSAIFSATAMLTTDISNVSVPAGSAKLTLEGLEHWAVRLASDIKELNDHIAAAEAISENWYANGECAEGLVEMRELQEKKTADLEAVEKAVSDIKHGLDCASAVASNPGKGPMLLVPKPRGSPATAALLQPAFKKPPPSSLYALGGTGMKTPVRTTAREMSRNVARQSAILANSPDLVTKKLIF